MSTIPPLASIRMTCGWYVAPSLRASFLCGSRTDGQLQPYRSTNASASDAVSATFRPRKEISGLDDWKSA
ncbi:MAG TPA: hypothetical protein VLA22_01040 [Gaiellaceae bacterium]|nr:hypothetical protein [Gaiellaceae bacterium]